jgi:hypothetical protein
VGVLIRNAINTRDEEKLFFIFFFSWILYLTTPTMSLFFGTHCCSSLWARGIPLTSHKKVFPFNYFIFAEYVVDVGFLSVQRLDDDRQDIKEGRKQKKTS